MRSSLLSLWLLQLLQATGSPALAVDNKPCLPSVDLEYAVHQAIAHNTTTDVYKFSNIRYAQAPTGDLRFRAPLPPLVDRSEVQNGARYRACPQAMPMWQAKAYIPLGKYSGPAPFTLEGWKKDIANSKPPPGLLETMNDNVSEDCLFLDVHAPRKAYKNADKLRKKNKGVPVIVWIHGGGYILGSKTGHPRPYMNPDGLITEARNINREGIVFVAINYRLGALGFLAGPEVRADGELNAGLLDQRLALQWVQDNIHRFGGDPKRVTVMGESAGGGSALYHMASFGGRNGSSLFSQVIAQSPATIPRGTPFEDSYGGFLKTLGVENLAHARRMSERDVIAANAAQIGAAPPTTYIFGPVADGSMVPGEVSKRFLSGAFDHKVNVMTAYNAFEGGFFFDPNVITDDDFHAWIAKSLAGLSGRDVDHLANVLYPPRFDGSLGYADQAERQMTLWEEAIFECSFAMANRALKGKSFAYKFSVTPGLHVQDTWYTFDDYVTPARDPIAQRLLQQALASFAVNGTPSFSSHSTIDEFPRWGAEQLLVNITGSGAAVSTNNVNMTRCAWWNNPRAA